MDALTSTSTHPGLSPSHPTQSGATNIGWGQLPAELRNQILGDVASLVRDEETRYPLSEAASVSKEWQAAVEKQNFKKLVITKHSLDRFEELFTNSPLRQAYLKHLRFLFELPSFKYEDDNITGMAGMSVTPIDSCDEFADALARLFSILAKWDVDSIRRVGSRDGDTGLSLELSVRCSDSTDEICLRDHIPPGGQDRLPEIMTRFGHHRWESVDSDNESEGGVFGLLELGIVTELSVLRHNCRRIDEDTLLGISLSLPLLKRIYYEPFCWPEEDFGMQGLLDNGILHPFINLPKSPIVSGFTFLAHTFPSLLELRRTLPLWPSSLKMIHIYRHRDGTNSGPGQAQRIKSEKLARGLALRSFRLEELSACNFIEATHFFAQAQELRLSMFGSSPTWDNLRSLTLTSLLLAKDQDRSALDALLRDAGEVASYMPALTIMEIYNADQVGGAVFRYEIARDSATISWTSTWQHSIKDEVSEVWRNVAWKSRSRYEPEFVEEFLSEYYGPVAFMFSHLKTRTTAIHPTTLVDLSSQL